MIKIFFQACALSLIFITSTPAKELTNMNSNTAFSVPSGFFIKSQQEVKADREDVILKRYVRGDNRNTHLGGEHFSTLHTPEGKLKGFVNITYDLVGMTLPAKDRAEQIAREFLRQYASDLLDNMELHWIAPHDEPIHVTHLGQAQDVTLTGMKVKMRNTQDGLWFWVIVGGDEQVIVFERDVYWISFPGKRRTEKWLHDSYLAKMQALGHGN